MVTVNPELLQGLSDEISELDIKLDQAAGSEKAARKVVTDRYMEKYKPHVEDITGKVTTFFDDIQDDDEFLSVFVGLQRSLKGYDKRVDTIFESKKDEIEASMVKLSPEEEKEISEQRKSLVTKFKGLREILEMFHEDVSSIPMPKRRTGARGKRGPRAISLFTWEVDGVRLSPEKDSLTGVASLHGYETKKELSEAMKAAGLDLREPEDEITFTLKDGKVLHGVKRAQEEPEDDEDEDEEDDSESETDPDVSHNADV